MAVCSAILINEYSKEKKKKLLEYDAVLELISYIKLGLGVLGKSLAEMISEFSSENFEKSGLSEKIKDVGIGSSQGWRKSLEEKLFLMDCEDKEKFLSYLCGFGKNFAEEELRRTEDTLSYFELKQKEMKKGTEKNIKTAWLLFSTFFISTVILVL